MGPRDKPSRTKDSHISKPSKSITFTSIDAGKTPMSILSTYLEKSQQKHQAKTRQTLDTAPSRTKKSHIQQPSESAGEAVKSIIAALVEKSQQKHQAKTRQTLDAAPSRTKKSHIPQPSTTSSNASSNESV
eukprot:scaffold27051_cov113-Skeletonema_menzelii.AAC.2